MATVVSANIIEDVVRSQDTCYVRARIEVDTGEIVFDGPRFISIIEDRTAFLSAVEQLVKSDLEYRELSQWLP